MDTPLIDTRRLFLGGDARHTCCSCCAGYCPRDGMDPSETDEWPDLFRVEVAGVAYLTDRYVAVRADLCQPVPKGVPVGTLAASLEAQTKGFTVPETQPAPTSTPITPWTWDRIDLAGLAVHGDPVTPSPTLHMYRDSVHVGWVMPAKQNGVTREELELVRRIAVAADIDLASARKAMRVALGQED